MPNGAGAHMESTYLGRSGLKVSEFAFGTMTFGREADEATSHAMLDLFTERGGNFIDTADVYGNGTADEVFARWLAGKNRDDVVVASKVRFPTGEGMNDVGLSRKHVISSLEASLRRLGTDHLDLFQIHCWDRGTPIEETLTTLDQLVRDGKVRYLGSSNLRGWQLQKMIDTSRQLGLEAFVSHQPQYNLLARETEWEVLEVCAAEGVGVIPWAPLRGGWLSGRYTREMAGPPEGSRVKTAEEQGWSETWARYATEHTWGIVDELRRIAEAHGTSPATVAIRWVAQHAVVTAPILGASRFEQLESNLGAIDIELTEDDMAALDRVSHVDGSYPYDDFIDNAQRGR
ncbi:MAG: aldo/keto reductase [Ilumatobacter sp.]|uniref:aldo/keto reductase n=1 Tax=Ilumatobacter sp. TaxID=1967498 RepID=UPI00260B0C09|nr:aldo/keto reductase [Ilumatobacter sp.]MDJ0771103.1 aldo/keto reductase [Ilumatobacter sp.]